MDLGQTVLLGGIAGSTILLGLPIGRLRSPKPSLRLMLNALAIGVLLFLVWDVLSKAWQPVDDALQSIHGGHGGLGSALGYGVLMAAGLAVGLLGLVGYERLIPAREPAPASPHFGPGAMTVGEPFSRGRFAAISANPARRLALMIAVGIGLHNLAEGLAIGQAAAAGEIALATLLVIGFGLHNATEGFGITAPLAGDVDDAGERRLPSWGYLLMLGVIGGGPTFVGTLIGHAVTSVSASVVFLSLAAGSILYVVIQLLGVAGRARRPGLLATGILVGLFAGFLTDAIVTAGGA